MLKVMLHLQSFVQILSKIFELQKRRLVLALVNCLTMPGCLIASSLYSVRPSLRVLIFSVMVARRHVFRAKKDRSASHDPSLL